MIRIWPRPMRLSPLGMVTRTKVIRKASGGGKEDPESGSKTGANKGVRVADKAGERRQQMLAEWHRTRRVDSGKRKEKGTAGSAVAAGLKGGGKGRVAGFHVTAGATGKLYRDLTKPMASG